MNPKAELKRAKAAMVLAKKLDAAVEAMTKYRHACIDCEGRHPYADDTRVTLTGAMVEYSGWLDSVYAGKVGRP